MREERKGAEAALTGASKAADLRAPRSDGASGRDSSTDQLRAERLSQEQRQWALSARQPADLQLKPQESK